MSENRFFVDTNLILYSIDSSESAKRRQAMNWLNFLWESGTGRLSWQVSNEFYVNASRKMRMPASDARKTVLLFRHWQPVETSLGLIERAWYWMDQAETHYWDSLILAAAERSQCTWLLSEDFQTGRNYEGVTVIDPFQKSPAELDLKLS